MVRISWPTFLASFAVGIFFVYVTQAKPKVVVVYPTPDNTDRLQYKDTAGNCYHFKADLAECPKDISSVHNIPVQK